MHMTEKVRSTEILPKSAMALDFFLQMFEHDLVTRIVMQMILYVMKRESCYDKWIRLTLLKFKATLGTTLLIGVTQLLHLHCHCSTNYCLEIQHTIQVFPRDCFLRILRKQHFNDINREIS